MRKADNFATFLCRLSGNSGSLNLLQPYGPLKACHGIAFYFYNRHVTCQKFGAPIFLRFFQLLKDSMFYNVPYSTIISEKPTRCTNDTFFLSSLHLHVSITFDHHQGALLQSTVLQRYVHSSKICLFLNTLRKKI